MIFFSSYNIALDNHSGLTTAPQQWKMLLHFELILLSYILVGSVGITVLSLKSKGFFFHHLLEWEQDQAQLSIFSNAVSNLSQTWAAQFGCTA